MEIPVTLVPSIDAQAWPNEIYVGYATGWMRRYDQEFDPDQPAPRMATTTTTQRSQRDTLRATHAQPDRNAVTLSIAVGSQNLRIGRTQKTCTLKIAIKREPCKLACTWPSVSDLSKACPNSKQTRAWHTRN